jgi:predicted metal-dependent HD superfamily phosphohydrolase
VSETDEGAGGTALPGLRADWGELLREAGADPAAGERVFAELVAAYREPGRFYHNLDHLAEVLAVVASLRGQARDLPAVRLAAWFHDAVYDPRAADNEERSAAWAEGALGEMGISRATGETVRRLILLTKAHAAGPEDADGRILLDADLSILGTPEARYRAYAAAIRKEYAWVPEESYRAGRGRVLRSFLASERIFTTRELFEAREARARRNLQDELTELEAGG